MSLLVIGSGIVGLWVAYKARLSGEKVIVIDKNFAPGQSTSKRNSGVLHAGIYYAPGSKKAFHCVDGYHKTLEFLKENSVPFNICGKYIIPASDPLGKNDMRSDEIQSALEMLAKNARANNVDGISVKNITNDLPFLNAEIALFSSKTGVLSIESYIEALYVRCQEIGVEFKFRHECVSADGLTVKFYNHENSVHLIEHYDAIVNSSGLFSDEVAKFFGITEYKILPNKGLFFRLSKPLPVDTLVYPLPFSNSTHLGCHYTIDVNGTPYIGPNAQWAESKEDYSINPDKEYFYNSLQRLTPLYNKNDLISTNRVGLRPRLFKNDEPIDDFVIHESQKGVVHLLGIESPGLTSAPSLADNVLEMVGVY